MCFQFILILLLGSTKPCKCCWKCAIIKVALIGDTVTFCSAQITARAIHKAWHLCLLRFSLFSLARKELFLSSFLSPFHLLLQTLSLHGGDQYRVFLCSNIAAATDHTCTCMQQKNRHKGFSGHFVWTMLAILGNEIALISVITGEKK